MNKTSIFYEMSVINENTCTNERVKKKKKKKKKLSNYRLFVYTLEYTRPCANGECAIGMYSRNKGVVCEHTGMNIRHTHNMLFEAQKRRRRRRKGRERERERETEKK